MTEQHTTWAYGAWSGAVITAAMFHHDCVLFFLGLIGLYGLVDERWFP